MCELIVDCVNKTAPTVDYPTPFKMLRTPNIKNGVVDTGNCKYVTSETFDKWTRRAKIQPQDVLLTREAPLGEVGIVKNSSENLFLGQRIMQYRANKNILDPAYLLYSFLSKDLQDQFRSHEGSGSVVSHIRVPDCSKFELFVPPLNEQKKISKILSDLDDKIHLNNQINQTLESIAQAIFKSWFIDFEPVRAKIAAKQAGQNPELTAMCAISGKSEAELQQIPEEDFAELQATAALFPDEFVESELGEVPKEWEVKPLDKIANYLNGLALQKFRPENEYDFLPIVKIAQLKSGVATIEEKASPNIDRKFIIENGDVIFSWSGSLMVDIWCGRKAALNQHLFKVTSNDYHKWLYYFYTKHHLAEFQRIAQAKAVTMGHIKREHLSQALCCIASNQLLEISNIFIGHFLQKLIELRLENNNLKQLRDTLLPKLLSGEVEVENL